MSQERLETAAERAGASRQTGAAADLRRSRVGAVITGADTTSVEIFRTIGHGRRPFAYDHPKVERRELRSIGASGGEMLCIGLLDALF